MASTDTGACSHGLSFQGVSRFDPPEIAVSPRHGELRIEGARIRYRSHPGYEGADAYSFKRCWDSRGNYGCTTVAVSIAVAQGGFVARHPGKLRQTCAKALRASLGVDRSAKLPMGSREQIDRCVAVGGPA